MDFPIVTISSSGIRKLPIVKIGFLHCDNWISELLLMDFPIVIIGFASPEMIFNNYLAKLK